MNVNVFIFMRRVRSHNKSWSSGNISVAFFFYVYISISMDIIFEMQAVWDSLASIIWGCEGDWGGGRGGGWIPGGSPRLLARVSSCWRPGAMFQEDLKALRDSLFWDAVGGGEGWGGVGEEEGGREGGGGEKEGQSGIEWSTITDPLWNHLNVIESIEDADLAG